MTQLYQKVRLSDHEPIDAPAPLPASLQGLQDVSLADLSWLQDPELVAAYEDHGLWPVVEVIPAHDSRTHQVGGWGDVVVDIPAMAVTATRLITARENADPFRVNKVDFLRLFTGEETRQWNKLKRQIASLTEADYDDPAKALLVQAEAAMDRFNALPEFVELDHPETMAFVGGLLTAAGVLTAPRAAEVLAGTPPA